MPYTVEFCGHPDCGAPIERWSSRWTHKDRSLDRTSDGGHDAVPPTPADALDEGLYTRADRYAEALSRLAAVQPRLDALTELVQIHEWHRAQAESALNAVEADPQFGTVWYPTGPEPGSEAEANGGGEVMALLCLVSGEVFRRTPHPHRTGWKMAGLNQSGTATVYEWPIGDYGPFIGWKDDYGYDKTLREAERLSALVDRLHSTLYSVKGYRDPEATSMSRPDLVEAVHRILLEKSRERSEQQGRASLAEQRLANLRRAIDNLVPDATQQWGQDGEEDVRDVEVIDLAKVQDLLDRPETGGTA